MRSRIGRLVVALFLAFGAGAVVMQSPAAAVADPVFIQNALTKGCVDQHYNNGPTTTVHAWRPCHPPGNRPGNQQWGFQHVWGNYYKILSHRNSSWCLSQPNVGYTPIYAESCQPYNPNKQLWVRTATPWGYALFMNVFTGRCMTVDLADKIYGGTCPAAGAYIDPRMEWSWRTEPLT